MLKLTHVLIKGTSKGITMDLIAEVMLLVTAVTIVGTVQSQVRGYNSYILIFGFFLIKFRPQFTIFVIMMKWA